MAIRFDGGKGSITCDECNVIIDTYVAYDPERYDFYVELHKKQRVLCIECKQNEKKAIQDAGEEHQRSGKDKEA